MNILKNVLNIAFTTGIAALLFLILSIFLDEYIRFRTKCHIWILLLLRMLIIVPIYNLKLPIPINKSFPISSSTIISNFSQLGGNITGNSALTKEANNIAGFHFSMPEILLYIWILGMILGLIYTVSSYLISTRTLLKWCTLQKDTIILNSFENARDKLGIHGTFIVCTSSSLSSPLVLGIRKKYLILPNKQFENSELDMIFYHELIHCKHKDLLTKLLYKMIRIIYWFNPIVYIIKKHLFQELELACDEEVVDLLGSTQRKKYVHMLLGFAYQNNKTADMVSNEMGGGILMLKRRLENIMCFKSRKKLKLLSCLIALLLTLTIFIDFKADASANNPQFPMSQVVFKELITDVSSMEGPYVIDGQMEVTAELSNLLQEKLNTSFDKVEPVENQGFLNGITLFGDKGNIILYPQVNEHTYIIYNRKLSDNDFNYSIECFFAPLSYYDEMLSVIQPYFDKSDKTEYFPEISFRSSFLEKEKLFESSISFDFHNLELESNCKIESQNGYFYMDNGSKVKSIIFDKSSGACDYRLQVNSNEDMIKISFYNSKKHFLSERSYQVKQITGSNGSRTLSIILDI